jgi:hypothetical protein
VDAILSGAEGMGALGEDLKSARHRRNTLARAICFGLLTWIAILASFVLCAWIIVSEVFEWPQ